MTLMLRNLWVLHVSLFVICAFNLSFCGWLMLVMDTGDIMGVSSSSVEIFWALSSSSFFDSSASDSPFPYASHVYNFFELSSM